MVKYLYAIYYCNPGLFKGGLIWPSPYMCGSAIQWPLGWTNMVWYIHSLARAKSLYTEHSQTMTDGNMHMRVIPSKATDQSSARGDGNTTGDRF